MTNFKIWQVEDYDNPLPYDVPSTDPKTAAEVWAAGRPVQPSRHVTVVKIQTPSNRSEWFTVDADGTAQELV